MTSQAVILIIFINSIVLSDASCSSIDYSNKIGKILSLQNDYDIYEGKLMFIQNASIPQANPSGIYGVMYFLNITEIVNPYSLSQYDYFLRPSNALIFSGCTPPKSIYFSLTSYIMNRFNYIENNATHKRELLFASLGAALNNLVWNTSSIDMSLNYDSLTTVIQSADQQTYNDIYNLLIQNDISSTEINVQSLPNKYINFTPYQYNSNNITQYTSSYDTGTLVLRLTLTENQTEYLQYIKMNQTVFMLQPKIPNYNDSEPKIPYDIDIRNTYSARNFNETSSVYNNALNEYKVDLIQYMKETYDLKYEEETIIPIPTGDCSEYCYGFQCIDENHDCIGDCRDTLYGGLNVDVQLRNHRLYIVIGIIHTNEPIKQTIYSSLVYNYHHNHPFENYNNAEITNFDYNGSGLILPINTSVNKDILKNIFVVQMGLFDNCIEALSDKLCIQNPPETYAQLVSRNYVNPITKTRPDADQLIRPIVLTFRTKITKQD